MAKPAKSPPKFVPAKSETSTYEHSLIVRGVHVGLDLSLRSTAVSVMSQGKLVIYRFMPGDLRGCNRLQWLLSQIAVVVPVMATSASMEGYSFGSQSNAHSLGELGGVIRLELVTRGHRLCIVSPGTLKKFITGNGNAKGKGAMILEIMKRWGFSLPQDDEADATALAILGAYQAGGMSEPALPKTHLQALEGVEWLSLAGVNRPVTTPVIRERKRERLQPVAESEAG